MKEFKEKQIVGGISYGRAFIIKDNKEIVSNIIVKNKELELDNFKKALDSLKEDFAQVIKKTQSEDEKDIINTHLAFLEDEIFIDEIKEKISSNCSAIYSINLIFSKYIDILLTNNKLEQARTTDLIDVKRQLINKLINYENEEIPNHPYILVANEIFPSDISKYKGKNLKGVISSIGGVTSHSAIILKSLGVPYITNYDIKKIKDGDYLLIGDKKNLIKINPDINLVSDTSSIKSDKNLSLKELDKINLEIDCVDEKYLDIIKGQPIGMIRTELLYMNFSKKPSFKDEVNLYKKVLDAAYPSSLTIRLFDFSLDKQVPYFNIDESDLKFNKVGIRLIDKYYKIFYNQLDAILTAYNLKSDSNLNIVIPMVSSVDEVIKVREIISEIIKKHNYKFNPRNIKIGIMVEVIISALELGKYEGVIDFISIGTNDLIKSIFFINRDDPKFDYDHIYLNEAFISFLKEIKKRADAISVKTKICGVMSSKYENIKKLVEEGFTNFTVSYDKISTISNKLKKDLNL